MLKIASLKGIFISLFLFISILNANENSMKIVVVDEIFELKLYENRTVEEFKKLLPLTLNMRDLHNNEKYATLPKTLPTNKEYLRTIKKGELMLFGNDTLVLFYDSFSTSYSYTKIGFIEDLKGLEKALGKSNITIKFE
ncbi:cyclophilin-like fold protein [Aliarcobacter cryaerophilus]|uniref:cyclophilin-like fold protein n=1 Tax=Aliarcobacter cryaerophilus TaxID=28198 RepID=UPI003DA62457